jgi:hypothetical protein
MTCQICFDDFPEMYKVGCSSSVDHLICFGCEKQWREKMPIRDGKRKMTCPTCRQEETNRTMDSLERELAALYVAARPPMSAQDELVNAYRVITSLAPASRAYVAQRIIATTLPPPVARTPPVVCASGRDCFTRSRVNARSKTILKCRTCREVACCKTCMFCTGCMPLSTSPAASPAATA